MIHPTLSYWPCYWWPQQALNALRYAQHCVYSFPLLYMCHKKTLKHFNCVEIQLWSRPTHIVSFWCCVQKDLHAGKCLKRNSPKKWLNTKLKSYCIVLFWIALLFFVTECTSKHYRECFSLYAWSTERSSSSTFTKNRAVPIFSPISCHTTTLRNVWACTCVSECVPPHEMPEHILHPRKLPSKTTTTTISVEFFKLLN